MKIQDLFEQSFVDESELVPVVINGTPTGAFCKLLSLDEMSDLLSSGGGLATVKFSAKLLAVMLVNPDGTPIATEAEWLRFPFRQRERFEALVTEVSTINGLLTATQAETLGKPSETTGALALSSSSASDSEKPVESCAAE